MQPNNKHLLYNPSERDSNDQINVFVHLECVTLFTLNGAQIKTHCCVFPIHETKLVQ